MAPAAMAVATTSTSGSYQLDPAQTLRAANALLKKMQSDLVSRSENSKSLLADSDDSPSEPIWLLVTTKKHITDKAKLKPGKIPLPHSFFSSTPSADGEPGQKICVMTTDPQRYYKDLVAHPSFPSETRDKIGRVIGLGKLKAKYKSYEAKRQLFSEYDAFLADDRVVTYLPKLLGKAFYGTGAKRPIPISLQGKRTGLDEKGEKKKPLSQGGAKAVRVAPQPGVVGKEIERALGSALVHLSPGTNFSVKVGTTGMSAEDVKANLEVVVRELVERFIPSGWKNVKGLHVKGPRTISLPVWLAEEMWVGEEDVLDVEPGRQLTKKERRELEAKGQPRALTSGAEAPKRRRPELTEEEAGERAEKKARRGAQKEKAAKLKEGLRKQVEVV